MPAVQPFVLGLTGGIAAGKSTCSAWLAAAGLPVFDADAEVAALYRLRAFVADLEAEFGPLGADPRRALAARVAVEPGLLDRAYALSEERLRARFDAFLAASARWPLVVLDAPLLLERGWDARCDAVLCVMTDRAERLRRALGRPGMTEAKFAAIDASQASDDERRARSTFLLDGGQPREAMEAALAGTLHEVAALADARIERLRRGLPSAPAPGP